MKLYQKYKSDHDNFYTSYLKLLGEKKLVDIIGWIKVEDGETYFRVTDFIFDDGSRVDVYGSHDDVSVGMSSDEEEKMFLKVYRSDPDNEETNE